MLSDLIKALQIFLKYRDTSEPTHCEHDVMMISSFTKDEISKEDQAALNKLGFSFSVGEGHWVSYKFGSA